MLLPAKPQNPEMKSFISTRPSSSAARFDRWNLRQIGRQIVCRKGFNVHFDQADKRTAKIRSVPAAAVNDHPDSGHSATVRSDDIKCFLDPPTAGHYVLGHDKSFVRLNLKPPAQHQCARFFFHENVPFPQGPSDFLTDDDSAQGRRDDRVTIDLSKLVREPGADIRCDSRVLEEQGALK